MIYIRVCWFLSSAFSNLLLDFVIKIFSGLNLSLGLLPSSLNNMSFGIHCTFSINYWTLDSVQLPTHWAGSDSSVANISAGTGGSGFQISVSHSTSVWGSWRLGGPGWGHGRVSGRHRGHSRQEGNYAMPEWLSGFLPGEGEKPGAW